MMSLGRLGDQKSVRGRGLGSGRATKTQRSTFAGCVGTNPSILRQAFISLSVKCSSGPNSLFVLLGLPFKALLFIEAFISPTV